MRQLLWTGALALVALAANGRDGKAQSNDAKKAPPEPTPKKEWVAPTQASPTFAPPATSTFTAPAPAWGVAPLSVPAWGVSPSSPFFGLSPTQPSVTSLPQGTVVLIIVPPHTQSQGVASAISPSPSDDLERRLKELERRIIRQQDVIEKLTTQMELNQKRSETTDARLANIEELMIRIMKKLEPPQEKKGPSP